MGVGNHAATNPRGGSERILYTIHECIAERARLGDALTKRYIQHVIDVYNVRIKGKAQAGGDATYEINVVKELESIL